jgi:hypothetical protein
MLQDEDIAFIVEILLDFSGQCKTIAAAVTLGKPVGHVLYRFDGAWMLNRVMLESLGGKQDSDGHRAYRDLSARVIQQLTRVAADVGNGDKQPQEPAQPATPPLAISRQIDQTDFELDPDGSLAIIRSQSYGGEGGLVRLTLREAYACWAFFRLPGVEQLLVRADTERQTKLQLEYEEEKREDEARIANGTYR